MMLQRFSILLCVWVGLTVLASSPQEEGLRIAKLTDEANEGFTSETAELEMILINAHGDETVRRLDNAILEKEGGDLSLGIFRWPADVKGTRMLTWSHHTGDDDQWLFLPALKRVKRISSRNKSGAFMGSEFSYEDLGSQEIEEFTYEFLGDVELDGRPCWKNVRYPVSPRSGYTKEVVWIDKEYMNPVKIEYYDRKGELLKISTLGDYKKYDRWWRMGKIHMKNVQTQKQSILTWKSRELGKPYEESYFSSDNLAE